MALVTIQTLSNVRTCTFCRAMVEEDATYCKKCNRKLDWYGIALELFLERKFIFHLWFFAILFAILVSDRLYSLWNCVPQFLPVPFISLTLNLDLSEFLTNFLTFFLFQLPCYFITHSIRAHYCYLLNCF